MIEGKELGRPRKPRLVDGIPLADNLYLDNKGRPGYYRYRRPDGTFTGFRADTVAQANAHAEDANRLRDITVAPSTVPPGRQQLAFHVPDYINYQERINPALKNKRSWRNRVYALHQFAEHFSALPMGRLKWAGVSQWWDGLGYNQQKLRHAEFRRLFNWLMAQGLLPQLEYNPFTRADDRPRLVTKQQPAKGRMPLTLPHYWKIYPLAGEMGYEALQIAMGISLYTTYRREDICNLRWDTNLQDRILRAVIRKSAAQRGSARAARHAWNLDKHPRLDQLIRRARELSLVNRRCPYIISHWPRRRVWNQDKTHLGQVTPERLSRMFAEVRDATEIFEGSSRPPPTFHEVRGLSSVLHRTAGYSVEQIQEIMAHEGPGTTLGYQNEQDLPHTEMELVLPDEVIGGDF